MRKIASLLLAALLLTALVALPSSAVEAAQVKTGTPVIDGELEPMWEDSVTFGIDEDMTSGEPAIEDATAYLLWDKDAIYVAAKIYDTDYSEHSGVVVFFSANFNNGKYSINTVKFTSDGYIGDCTTGDTDDPNSLCINTRVAQSACGEYDGYYILEMSLPLQHVYGINDMGDIVAGVDFRMHLAISNNVDELTDYVILGNGGTFLDNNFVVIRKKAKNAETTATDTVAADTTVASDTTAATETKSGCHSVVAAPALALVAVLGGAVVVTRKKED